MPRAAILFFQNEANFSPREAYLPMNISCKFGEASWCSFPLRALIMNTLSKHGGVVNTEPKYPLEASGGYTSHCKWGE